MSACKMGFQESLNKDTKIPKLGRHVAIESSKFIIPNRSGFIRNPQPNEESCSALQPSTCNLPAVTPSLLLILAAITCPPKIEGTYDRD